MNKNKLIIIVLSLFSVAMFFVISSSALAVSCDSTSYYGISGTSSSLAGLVVHTKDNGTDKNMSVTVSEKQAGEGVCSVTSSYKLGTCYNSKTWDTGSVFYNSQQSSTCYKTGYLVLGYGDNDDLGNAYALDCKNDSGTKFQFTIKITSANPSEAGKWDYAVSGAASIVGESHVDDYDNNKNPSVTITVNNGDTAWVTFNWVRATVNLEPELECPATAEPGETITCTQTVTNNGNYPTEVYIHNSAVSNGKNNTERNGSYEYPYSIKDIAKTWNPDVDQGAGSYVTTETTKPYPHMAWRKGSTGSLLDSGSAYTIRIEITISPTATAGKWISNKFGTGTRRTLKNDVYHIDDEVFSNVYYIEIKESPPPPPPSSSLSCSAEPQQGPIPLVVTFTISGENLERFNFYPGINDIEVPYTLEGGSKTIYYTYDSAGTYRPYVSSSETGQSYCTVGSSSNGVNVTDPRESSGGETTP